MDDEEFETSIILKDNPNSPIGVDLILKIYWTKQDVHASYLVDNEALKEEGVEHLIWVIRTYAMSMRKKELRKKLERHKA